MKHSRLVSSKSGGRAGGAGDMGATRARGAGRVLPLAREERGSGVSIVKTLAGP